MPSLLHPVPCSLTPSSPLEQDIIVHLDGQDVVTLDALIKQMPQYSWSHIFQAVDTLARCGRISLHRHGFVLYARLEG
jgi:hypothetical protein